MNLKEEAKSWVSGPDHACEIIHCLIRDIKANASAESEDKPIAEDPKVGNDDL